MSALETTPPQPSRATTIWVWFAWVLVVSMGWGIAWFTSAMTSFSSGIYDPDEVEAFRRAAPGGMLSSALLMGTVVGLMFGVPLGLYQWLREKRGLRQALITAATVIALSVLVCVFSSPGPTQVVGRQVVDVSSGFVGGFLGGVWAGGLQYYLLRRSVRGYWVVATIITWAIAWAGLTAIQSLIEPDVPALSATIWLGSLVPLCGGGLIGLAQWLFLRRVYRRAAWWIPAWALGWLATYWLTVWIGFWGVLALGAITATVLAALPRQLQTAPAGQILDNPAQ